MSGPDYPDVPEIVDIALRDALLEARHPRVREHIREAMQWRMAILGGDIDIQEAIRGKVQWFPRTDGSVLVGDDLGWVEADANGIQKLLE